jgi:hypothetical protein
VLRAADPRTFGSDPLRGLRVMQIAARFAMEPDAELIALAGSLDLADLPGERVLVEFDKLLLRADEPSRGLDVLRRTGLARFFPDLDLATANARALDAAAAQRTGCSRGSRADVCGAVPHPRREPARAVLERLRAPHALGRAGGRAESSTAARPQSSRGRT